METRVCGKCNLEKKEYDFYYYKTKFRAWCKDCDKINTIIRQAIYKKLCVEYKGGKCEICGYDKYIGALDFHHKDPSQKKFNIAAAKLRQFNNETIEELNKCQMLCANCHREVHNIHNIEELKNTWIEYEKQKQNQFNLLQQKNNTCSCGNKKCKKSKQCLKCNNKKSSERNVDEVIAKIKETNWTKAGKFFGVSDNALRKFLKNRGIDIDKLE